MTVLLDLICKPVTTTSRFRRWLAMTWFRFSDLFRIPLGKGFRIAHEAALPLIVMADTCSIEPSVNAVFDGDEDGRWKI